jgi:hypothetical protein
VTPLQDRLSAAEGEMYVWVNSTDGWVIHGTARPTLARARKVARILEQRCGWETATGTFPPPPRAPRKGAPSAKVAQKSPEDCPPPPLAR